MLWGIRMWGRRRSATGPRECGVQGYQEGIMVANVSSAVRHCSKASEAILSDFLAPPRAPWLAREDARQGTLRATESAPIVPRYCKVGNRQPRQYFLDELPRQGRTRQGRHRVSNSR